MTIDRFQTEPPCRVLVFTSPKAGSGAGREQIPKLNELLDELSVSRTTVHTLDDLKHELDASRHSHSNVVVAAGGDGTIALAASAMSSHESEGNSPELYDVPIVPMPLGTENLLARHFGQTADANAVLETIRHGKLYRLDEVVAGGRRFLIMATAGFDAEVVRCMDLTRKGHINRLSYLTPIFRAIRDYKFPKIEIRVDEGPPLECYWAMVFNLPCYGGGLRIEPDANGHDGMLDVIAFQRGGILNGIRYVVGIWLHRHLKFKDVVRTRGRVVEISCPEEVMLQLDGDYAGKLPVKIEVAEGTVELLVPG